MDVTPLVRKGQKIIQSYSGGSFKINGDLYEHAVIVSPDNVLEWDINEVQSAAALQERHFADLISMSADFDVILLGSGAQIQFLTPDLKKSLRAKGINVEVMDTGAACRTYNVLMAEGRRVVSALMPSV